MAMERDKDKIEAALAMAVSNSNGSNPPPPQLPPKTRKMEAPEDSDISNHKQRSGKARAIEENEINAKDMFLISSQNPDPKIHEHIAALNARIMNEAQRGGFSTHVVFSVIQTDWVNIQHILDWYRARGFQILNFDQTTSPYGKQAGTIQYNFTISWATPM